MKDYKKQSDLELTDELRILTRELKTLQCKHESINPTTPQHFVEVASIEESLGEVKAEQVAIGKELVVRNQKREEENVKRLEEKSKAGEQAAKKLLDKLPGFASDVSVAFTALGKEYAEILALSEEIRKTNSLLRHHNLPPIANLHKEPNHLHKILKMEFKQQFGSRAADVFIPQNVEGFDIKEAVKMIIDQCSTEAG